MFWFFLFVFVIIIIGFIFSTIKLSIKKLEADNTTYGVKCLRNVDARIKIYWFGIVKVISIKLNKKRLNNLKLKNIINEQKSKLIKEKLIKNFSLKDLKKIDITLEKLDFNLNIGTEDVIMTSFLIFIISNIITYVVLKNIKNYNRTKYHYIINPCYQDKNIFMLDVSCIISIRTVHIINMLYRYMKRSEYKNERTSNRRTYDNSYEQYTGYGRCKYNYRGADRNI